MAFCEHHDLLLVTGAHSALRLLAIWSRDDVGLQCNGGLSEYAQQVRDEPIQFLDGFQVFPTQPVEQSPWYGRRISFRGFSSEVRNYFASRQFEFAAEARQVMVRSEGY